MFRGLDYVINRGVIQGHHCTVRLSNKVVHLILDLPDQLVERSK
jgi:hypothetical protein